MWKCIYLPWHKLKVSKRYKNLDGYQVKCSCGKLYVMSDSLRTILPWDRDVEKFYENEEIAGEKQ